MRRMLLAVVGLGLGAGFLGLFFGLIAWEWSEPMPNGNPPGCYPLAVEGTQLRVLFQAEYRGPMNGSVCGTAAAVLVENMGLVPLSRGAVVLEQQGRTLVFELKDLKPGERILLLEKDAQPYQPGRPQRCYGWTENGALLLTQRPEPFIPSHSTESSGSHNPDTHASRENCRR